MIKNHHGRVILGVLALSLLPLSLAAQGEMTAVGLASASEFSGSLHRPLGGYGCRRGRGFLSRT